MEQLIIGVFEQGFIYAIMALGVYITYKILDFPDLSVDSTFPLGAAVTTVMLSSGKNPLLALIAATAAGAIAGMVTGIIHVKYRTIYKKLWWRQNRRKFSIPWKTRYGSNAKRIYAIRSKKDRWS